MRRNSFLKLCVLLILFFLLPSSISAQTEVDGREKITLFEVDLLLEQDTDIRIKERIHYYFPEERHGIFRYIPINKRSEGNPLKKSTAVDIESVRYYPEANPSDILRFSSTSSDSDSEVVVKIGSPNIFVQGAYVYEIDYVVRNGINYFEDHDELYWNIIGTGWEIPIEKVIANIVVPGEITEVVCYTGIYGSKDSNCEVSNLENNKFTLSSTGALDRNEAITVAVSMPKGTLEDLLAKQQRKIAKINAICLSFLGLIPLFYLLHHRKEKGEKSKLVIVPNFHPPKDINLIMADSLLTGGAKMSKSITAEIINFAIDGHIEIEQVKKKEYILRKKSNGESIQEETSLYLFNSLFKDSDEVNTKYKNYSLGSTFLTISAKVRKDMALKGYIHGKRDSMKRILLALFMSLSILPIWVFIYLAILGAVVGGIAIVVTYFAIFILFTGMNTKTVKGKETSALLLGLKMYIKTAEKHRIEFHNDPEKYRGVFEQLLPYAILFGLEKKWVKEFEDIYTTPPDWYRGDISTFNASVLMSSISSIRENVSYTATPTGGGFGGGSSGSGGGGSSGGGGGGGGGGSW